MPRNNISKKDLYEKISKQEEEVINSNPSLVIDTGGSISNLPVKSKYLEEWIQNKQLSNPFIGSKYVEPATELNVEQKENGPVTIVDINSVKTDDCGFISDTEEEKDEVEEDVNNKDDFSGDSFIDYSIILNTTQKMIGSSNEEIMSECVKNIKDYHSDTDNYETNVDIENCVIESKRLILEDKNKNTKLLE